uniref:Germ cell nuclear acidic peptidase n=1 Tax=Rhinopithecus bieti TaxID=61621 RepID=A0A2K6JZP9_RHIBE
MERCSRKMEKFRKLGRMEGLSSSKGGEQSYCGKQKIDEWSRSEKVRNAMKKKTVAFILLSCFSPVSSLSSVVVIDSDSDDECYTYEEKKAKLLEINSDDESPECCYVKPAIQEPPIVIRTPDDNSDDSEVPDDNSNDSDVLDDNSNDLEVPDNNSNDLEVLVPAEDLCNEGQIASNEEELGEAAVSQHDSSDDAGEQDLGENLSKPPSDPEANLEVSERKLPAEEEPAPVVEQSGKRKSKTKTIVEPLKQQKAKTKTIVEPLRKRQAKTKNIVEPLRKRKAKTKNISVTPGRKKRGPSKKKHGAAKVEKRKTRTRKCKVPGCFLHGLEKSKRYSGKNLKRNRDELVRRIYDLFNRSVCDKKLPEKLRIGWNNKMLKTAGSCSTGEMWYPKRRRFAAIQIGLKVCDSADRIRDTLIHEICHAASWLIDGIRDSHGDTWKYYARKSNRIHPELPKVTRCHNYKINYKVHYECTGCKTRIGRYTKSLDTSRFICGKCEGSLVMVPLTQKHGTRIVPHV